jgi:hypothetical protein
MRHSDPKVLPVVVARQVNRASERDPTSPLVHRSRLGSVLASMALLH